MKRGDLLECRDCDALGQYPRDVTKGDWVYVLDSPPYALCPTCHAAVVRSALGRLT